MKDRQEVFVYQLSYHPWCLILAEREVCVREAQSCLLTEPDSGYYLFTTLPPSTSTIEPVLKDDPIGHKNVICQDTRSLVTGSVTCILKCWSFYMLAVNKKPRGLALCLSRWKTMTT